MILKGKEIEVPIIQGGMGVGVSMSGLAGHVALAGGIGVISSVNIGYKQKDFIKNPLETNLRTLKDEIKKAREISRGKGLIGVNIMTAVSHYDLTAKCAVEAGADVIISGAGLPLKLPEYTKGSKTMCAPIVSGARAARLIIKQYLKNYQVLPDFLVIEGHEAGGHLGFSREELAEHTAKSNEQLLSEVLEETKEYSIPLFVGGGVFDGKDMAKLIHMGASGVQMGTRFIATQECDASREYKQVILDAKKEDIRIIQSPVGMPARAIYTPLLEKLKRGEQYLANICNGCLTACPKGNQVPYCISRALIEAVKGNYEEGLFFTGSNAYRIDKIVKVRELIEELMKDYREYLPTLS